MSLRAARTTTRGGAPARLRVLIALLSAGFAGTERHAAELANALAGACDVAMLLRARPPGARGVPHDALRAAIDPAIPVFATSRAAPAPGAWWAIRRFRPDLIHAHHERSARILSRHGLGVPVIATVHVHYRARDFARCAGLICLTAQQASEVPPDFPGTLRVIGNWVLPHPRPADGVLAARAAEFGLLPGMFVVGTVGRLEPVKNVAGLLHAFAQAAIPGSRLLIVGDGDERPALEREAARLGVAAQVVFAGFRPDVRDLYVLFDVFALNSDDEPFGLAILEAAASGVPVIATDTTGARAIGTRHPIRRVPPGDPAALAAALREAWAIPAAAPPLRGFDVQDSVADVLEAYRAMLAA